MTKQTVENLVIIGSGTQFTLIMHGRKNLRSFEGYQMGVSPAVN
jgi:hypothetical protein